MQGTRPAREARRPQWSAVRLPKRRSRWWTLLKTISVWYWYVPHLAMLRFLGPRISVRIARVVAWLHWLPIFFGGHRTALAAIEEVRPYLDTRLSARAIVRRCLENKHGHFVLWSLATTKRGRRYFLSGCSDFEGREILDAARSDGAGVLILSFHYGIGRMLGLTVNALYGAEELRALSHITGAYSPDTLPHVARIAHNAMAYTEANSGLRAWEARPNRPPLELVRHLKRGHMVGLAGDGYMATDFVDVPFLGAALRLPTGVARLAALTGAPIIPLLGVFESLHSYRITAYPPIHCRANTSEAYKEAIAACARTLEEHVKQQPWGWWIWHRIHFETSPDGTRRIRAEGSADQ